MQEYGRHNRLSETDSNRFECKLRWVRTTAWLAHRALLMGSIPVSVHVYVRRDGDAEEGIGILIHGTALQLDRILK